MTKIPTEVLELAIKGGWYSGFLNPEKLVPCSWTYDGEYLVITTDTSIMVRKCTTEVALDREFWICLGRKLNWHEDYSADFWMAQASNFYQCVLSNQDSTEFWAELTANK